MHVRRIASAAEFASLGPAWNALARDIPFRGWEWLHAWWRHYGAGRELFLLGVEEGGRLAGIAPWYLEQSPARGRVLRMLGSGDVCSDYLSVLTTPPYEEAVTAAVAQWLTVADDPRSDGGNAWDLLELSGVESTDSVVAQLVAHLSEEGCVVHRRPGPNCWRIELPATWDKYVAGLSRSHRRQVRRSERTLAAPGHAVLSTSDDEALLRRGFEILVDLHQRRRQSLGEPGCFACPRFAGFLREMSESLIGCDYRAHDADPACGAGFDPERSAEPGGARPAQRSLVRPRVEIHWLEIDGRPAAAELQLVAGGIAFAYQAGIEPDLLDKEPGRLMNVALLKRSIEQGLTGFDFLRGDEPYKAHWRAEPHACLELRIVPRRTAAQLRHGAWLARDCVKQWIKTGLSLVGMH